MVGAPPETRRKEDRRRHLNNQDSAQKENRQVEETGDGLAPKRWQLLLLSQK